MEIYILFMFLALCWTNSNLTKIAKAIKGLNKELSK